jgi:hypothetical protein
VFRNFGNLPRAGFSPHRAGEKAAGEFRHWINRLQAGTVLFERTKRPHAAEGQSMATTFSEHARERLLELYNKHDHEVGRVLKEEHSELYKAFTPTDCITYALNVITYAYKKTNNDEAARQVKKLGAHGHRVSEYLVTKQRWVGVYISPDVTHPVDGSREHTFANQLVNKTCTYYQVPIKYRAVNYNPTPKDDPNFQKLNKKAPETSLNQSRPGGTREGAIRFWDLARRHAHVAILVWQRVRSALGWYRFKPLRANAPRGLRLAVWRHRRPARPG